MMDRYFFFGGERMILYEFGDLKVRRLIDVFLMLIGLIFLLDGIC